MPRFCSVGDGWMNEQVAPLESYWQGEIKRRILRKFCPSVILSAPQIPYGLACVWTWFLQFYESSATGSLSLGAAQKAASPYWLQGWSFLSLIMCYLLGQLLTWIIVLANKFCICFFNSFYQSDCYVQKNTGNVSYLLTILICILIAVYDAVNLNSATAVRFMPNLWQ